MCIRDRYRHGLHEVCLELPGGIIDPGESPKDGAVRELAEETGYVVSEVDSLGFVHPNPALQSNKCHLFLATGAELKLEQKLDSGEDIEVRLEPLKKVPELIENGIITHSMMVSAFLRLFLTRGSW